MNAPISSNHARKLRSDERRRQARSIARAVAAELLFEPDEHLAFICQEFVLAYGLALYKPEGSSHLWRASMWNGFLLTPPRMCSPVERAVHVGDWTVYVSIPVRSLPVARPFSRLDWPEWRRGVWRSLAPLAFQAKHPKANGFHWHDVPEELRGIKW